MSLEGNPFLNLFNSAEDAQRLTNEIKVRLSSEKLNPVEEAEEDLSSFLEDVFLLSNVQSTMNQFYTVDFKSNSQGKIFKKDLSFMVHERLLAKTELENFLRENPKLKKLPTYETDPLKYLTECQERLCNKFDEKDFEMDGLNHALSCSSMIMELAILLVEVPDQLEDFSPADHLLSLLLSNIFAENHLRFYAQLIHQLKEKGIRWLLERFRPVLDDLLKEVEGYHSNLKSDFEVQGFRFPSFLDFFVRNETLAAMLLEYDKQLIDQRSSFEKSLLGNLLSLGSDPKFFSVLSDYLDNSMLITQNTINDLENRIYKFLDELQCGLYKVFRKLLTFKNNVRVELLLWIGEALHSFKDRNKLWNTQMHILLPSTSGDNFLVNLQIVLLKSFQPYLEDHSKLLDIQPSYCLATIGREEALKRNVHMREIQETYLIPSNVGEESSSEPQPPSSSTSSLQLQPPPPSAEPFLEDIYKMSSEIFFMTHYCFNLGFSVIHERFSKLNQEMNQIRERYQESLNQGQGRTTTGLALKEQLLNALSTFYSCKTVLMQPHLLNTSFQFSVLTANFLVHVAMTPQVSPASSNINKAVFPPPSDTSSTSLKYIPEFIVHNVHSCLMFLKRTRDVFFEDQSSHLGSLLDFILLFMSGPQFIHNPHTRAEMAEALECLFPRTEQSEVAVNSLLSPRKLENIQREKLLSENANARHATACIMKLFVGMELTGQGVNFENKFRYRQPIYVMFKYLWEVELHRDAVMDLVICAEQHLEDEDAPLFLRFINLLINDATFLLDEALDTMAKIREKTLQRESNWSDFPANQRHQMEALYDQMSKLARFYNIMGLETIATLSNLTCLVHSIFTHSVMVDRLTTMLNYQLFHLVGPKRVNLKVKKPEEFKFDPRKLVLEICRIYENFSDDDNFLRAVSRDERSYSHDLFERASEVLKKIHESESRIAMFDKIANRIKDLASEEAEVEVADAPDEYLDPIMGILMTDPVLLPGSKKVVDRKIIARHLLSDQSDPFTRQPLTMNMIMPDEDLRVEIEEWLAGNRNRTR